MPSAITMSRFGGPEVLQWENVEIGDPAAGQVRLKQAASGLNYIDVYHRTGAYPQDLPMTPGVEGAGTVIALGEGVDHLNIGDRVAYAGPIGSYAEERLIGADQLVKLPDGISFEQAAAMMLQGMTAQMLLREVYPVKASDTVLVQAAAGGTGLILTQWAKALGATVIGTVSTEEKAEIARANGCDHPILYTQQDFVSKVDKITGGQGVAVVYDSVGATTFLKSLDCLRPRGMMVTFGQASGPINPIAPIVLSQKGSLYLTRPFLFHYIDKRQALERSAQELFDMVQSGKISIQANQTFAMCDAAKAHTKLENRTTTGSTILIV